METVVDAEGGEDVEVVFGVLVGDDDGLRLEDGVCGDDEGSSDGEVGGLAGSEPENQREDNAENEECQKNGHQQIASDGLSEFEVGHLKEDSKSRLISGSLK